MTPRVAVAGATGAVAPIGHAYVREYLFVRAIEPPTDDQLTRAAEVVGARLPPTPLVAAPELHDRAWLKLEVLQPTGSFKVRGALEALFDDDSSVLDHALVIAVGADTPGKRELGANVLAGARLIADDLTQAREQGELQHLRRDHPAELLGTVLETSPNDSSSRGRTVVDLTGLGAQDAAAASAALRALAPVRDR